MMADARASKSGPGGADSRTAPSSWALEAAPDDRLWRDLLGALAATFQAQRIAVTLRGPSHAAVPLAVWDKGIFFQRSAVEARTPNPARPDEEGAPALVRAPDGLLHGRVLLDPGSEGKDHGGPPDQRSAAKEHGDAAAGAHWVVQGTIADNGGEALDLSLFRTIDHPAFDEPTRSLFLSVLRSLRLSRQHGERVQDQLARFETLEAAMAMVGDAMLVIDSFGRIVWKSTAAKHLLAGGDPLAERNGRLTLHDTTAERHLLEAVGEVMRTPAGTLSAAPEGRHVVRCSDGAPCMLRLLPVDRRILPIAGAESGFVALVLAGTRGDGDILQNELRQLYGLTTTEARLVVHIAAGKRLTEVSADLGISINTAKSHMKRVYSKLGVERQAELIRMLGRAGHMLP